MTKQRHDSVIWKTPTQGWAWGVFGLGKQAENTLIRATIGYPTPDDARDDGLDPLGLPAASLTEPNIITDRDAAESMCTDLDAMLAACPQVAGQDTTAPVEEPKPQRRRRAGGKAKPTRAAKNPPAPAEPEATPAQDTPAPVEEPTPVEPVAPAADPAEPEQAPQENTPSVEDATQAEPAPAPAEPEATPAQDTPAPVEEPTEPEAAPVRRPRRVVTATTNAEVPDGHTVIRLAQVLVDYLATTTLATDRPDLVEAMDKSEERKAGKGATRMVVLPRPLAEQVLEHLRAQVTAERMAISIGRWRVERAVRMIRADLAR